MWTAVICFLVIHGACVEGHKSTPVQTEMECAQVLTALLTTYVADENHARAPAFAGCVES